MKLTSFTLPALLAVAIAYGHGSRLSAALNSISPRSKVEVIVDSYKGGAAATVLLAAGISTFSQTAPTHLLRSMWGQ
jgi:hypothetical protein